MFPIGNIFAASYPLSMAGNADKAPVIAIDGALGIGKGDDCEPVVGILEYRYWKAVC